MVHDSSEYRAGGKDSFTPMQIAHHSLFTAREKIELLQKLKAEVTGALENDLDLGFSPAEIDAAIEEVKLGAQRGEQTETVLRGDN
jgi:hypothetical protein